VDCAFVVVEVEGMNKSLYEKIMSGNKWGFLIIKLSKLLIVDSL
jgi:hypothetical protein